MNGPTHRVVGASVGASAALHRAWGKPTAPVVEAAGGGIAGWYFGRGPDILEPATSPNHRGPFHSVAFALVLILGDAKLVELQDTARAWANEQEKLGRQAQSWWAARWHHFLALVGRLGTGALSAVCPAYLSHLALDATTPRGLPFLA